jgi:2-polyprenyl-3-methyl-5-hydroxy-6-metoxy-1,4-benzoquinol methylase
MPGLPPFDRLDEVTIRSQDPFSMSSQAELITFSFGQNWRSFVDTVSEGSIRSAMSDIERWFGVNGMKDRTILDIGSGSGIHSLCFYLMGAREVLSIDVDPKSVESTSLLRNKAGDPENWKVERGSILDPEFVRRIKSHEIVYSWGVLHHTGSMWEAIDNASSLVRTDGLFLIAIYVKGPTYEQDLQLKQSYNQASAAGKKLLEWKEISKLMRDRWKAGKNPLLWNEKRGRGMDTYHDLVDWLGGLPYEVATADEVVDFCERRGLALKLIDDREANIVYLFSRPRA